MWLLARTDDDPTTTTAAAAAADTAARSTHPARRAPKTRPEPSTNAELANEDPDTATPPLHMDQQLDESDPSNRHQNAR